MTAHAGTFQMPGITIVVDTEFAQVGPGSEPNPEWSVVDKRGHLHAWVCDLDAPHHRATPTLRHVVDVEAESGFDPDGEEWYSEEESHDECVQCGEHIEPGYRRTPARSIPVETRITATVEEGHRTRTVMLTEEQFEEALWATARAVGALADGDPSIVVEQTVRSGG